MNFWGYIVKAFTDFVLWFVYGAFPTHAQTNIVQTISDVSSSTIGTVFIIIFSQINMTLPLICFLWFSVLELIRGGLGLWRLIAKKIIPMT